jgi:manganese transport protein
MMLRRAGRTRVPWRANDAESGRRSPFLGPAFVVAVAYIDPGNFATNIATGRSLPEICRDRFPSAVVVLLWLQAEALMVTRLSQF